MKVYNMYFSPTGGTRKVLELVSGAWDCDKMAIDLSDRTVSFADLQFGENDVCLVAVPSFSGRVPQFIIPHLKELHGAGTKAILITAYGNRQFDDTLIELKDAMDSAGFRCVGAVAAVTQHSLMPRYGAGRPDVKDAEELREFGKVCREVVETDADAAEVPGDRPYRPYINKLPLKPKVGTGCTECGLCAEKCPVQAITPQDLHNTDLEKCISCMQCVSVCPQNARHISKLIQQIAEFKMRKVCSGRKQNQLFCAGTETNNINK